MITFVNSDEKILENYEKIELKAIFILDVTIILHISCPGQLLVLVWEKSDKSKTSLTFLQRLHK